MDRDGTKDGYDTDLLKIISSRVAVPLIASGGAGEFKHFADACKNGASAVLAASLFHYKEMSIADLKKYLKSQNINTR
jgi:cyclase